MRLIACLLVCLVVTITTLDRVACPDGCTDEMPTHSASASTCTLCHGWSPAVAMAGPSPVALELLVRLGLPVRELASHPPAIDHPPKRA